MVSSGLSPAVLCHFYVGDPRTVQSTSSEVSRAGYRGRITPLTAGHTAFGAVQDTSWSSRSRGILEKKVSDTTDADKMPWKRHDMLCFQL